jgi:ATP-dependent Clp protease ATP-binding subunit ClpC
VFDAFTVHATRVIALAQEEARMLGHGQVSTGHLLLGLIGEGEGAAARALAGLAVTLPPARAQLEDALGRGPGGPPGEH